MNDAFWQRWRWTVACGAAVAVGLVGLVAHGDLWDWLGVHHMSPYFADLAAVLAAGQAKVAGHDIYQPNPFDPFYRPHVYGPLWLVTGPLGLTVGDALWLGAVLVLAFLVVALCLAAPRTPSAALVTGAILLSPPVLLGMERANNDLVIFLLLAGAGWLAAANRRIHRPLGAALIVLAGALKYYPLVAVPALAARPGRLRHLAAVGVACGLLFGGLWWLQHEEFSRALAIAPRPSTLFAYGFSLLPFSWEQLAPHRAALFAGFVLGAGLASALLWPLRRALWTALPLHGWRTFCAVAGGSAWLLCYFATTSFPYRAVLLLLVLPAWLAWAGEKVDTLQARLGRSLCALLLCVLWLAAPKHWWTEIYLASAGASSAGNWLVTVFGGEQVLWLFISGAIGVSIAGWAWRRWREGPL